MNDDQSRVHVDPATTRKDSVKTEVGSVFVSNYPPYSFWNSQDVEKALEAFGQPASQSPLGFYLHIPFCRKRCKFCYFKVYTGKNSSEIQSYLDGLAAEFETYARQPAVLGRPLKFIYFGGGTPSFISVKHLQWLTERLKDNFDTRTVSEFAFECEPGTLTASKLEAIREVGVSRLSLGVEHFDDRILADNGRAHTSTEIYRVWPWIKEMDFEQVNIDLIAGMVGESESSWMAAVEKAIELEPDSVTIYQLELPYNAIYSQSIRDGNPEHLVVADWETKRRWHSMAIDRFLAAGYDISSAYTLVRRNGKTQQFLYRDALWRGSDMLATGVASFGHINGVHFQNSSSWAEYLETAHAGALPVKRAYATTPQERFVREMILQMKLGYLSPSYFSDKFGVDILSHFAGQWAHLKGEGMLDFSPEKITLSRSGLLQVDQLLPLFYEEKYRNSRYT